MVKEGVSYCLGSSIDFILHWLKKKNIFSFENKEAYE